MRTVPIVGMSYALLAQLSFTLSSTTAVFKRSTATAFESTGICGPDFSTPDSIMRTVTVVGMSYVLLALVSFTLSSTPAVFKRSAATAWKLIGICGPAFSTNSIMRTVTVVGMSYVLLAPVSLTLSSTPTPCCSCNMPSIDLILSCITFSVSRRLPTPCIAFRDSAVAIRASSIVAASSLSRASSISLLPTSFFAIAPKQQ